MIEALLVIALVSIAFYVGYLTGERRDAAREFRAARFVAEEILKATEAKSVSVAHPNVIDMHRFKKRLH